MSHKAIYPGSFDPITYGHIDLIERARKHFDEIIVTVARNSRKNYLFSVEERLALIHDTLSAFDNVIVVDFEGLLVDFSRARQCHIILRGIRTISDFDFEYQLAGMNRHLAPDIETLFMITDSRYQCLSSSLLKELSKSGQSLKQFVPIKVEKALQAKLSSHKSL